MSKASATKQFLLVNSVLVNNQSERFIETFPSDGAQAIISNPVRAGREYEKFLLGLAQTLLAPPTIIELGEFEVNYDETIASKIAGNADPTRIGWHNREWATDEKFPDTRKGKKHYKVSAVNFGRLMPDEGDRSIAEWCANNKKIRATPKEGIDIALVNPRPKLDKVMPLAMAGQFFVGTSGHRCALYFRLEDGGKRFLSGVWLDPGGQWNGHWWFLVLEELPSES
jgi:hypothetical protein